LPNPPITGLDKFFSDQGYAIVKVDVRGTGASFGSRQGEYSPIEVMDAKDILDWIDAQAWSDGNVGSYGTSYEGTTAELLCATQHPTVKAVIPGWSDFDVYKSPVRPYGMLASGFIKKWGFYVRMLDRNNSLILRESILPVDEELLKSAIKEHKNNLKVYKWTKKGEYRNSRFGMYSYGECSPVYWEKQIEASNIPMLVLTSWLDAGTAEGTLQRLQYFSNNQKVLLMATNHGGWAHASPFVVSDSWVKPTPTPLRQAQAQLDFFDHHLKHQDKGVDDWDRIKYYTLGEEAYHETEVWPPLGVKNQLMYFGANGLLQTEKPTSTNRPSPSPDGADTYKVNFSTTTGKKNRWTTQMGGPVLNLDDRQEQDDKMLTYTTAPLEKDMTITGTPIIRLKISSTTQDGALFVYLEDVDENGQSRYITEGGLRLIHRGENSDSTSYNFHSFNEEDASFMEKDKIATVDFQLMPTSVMIKKGHSLRIAIGGADKHTFDRVPKRGRPVYTVYRGVEGVSSIEIPIMRVEGE
jgi:putative CocE/NonD family hydrolase